MSKEEKLIVANEIAKTFELYGFEMSFSEFKDVFELGSEFGYRLALINTNKASKKEGANNTREAVFSKIKFNTNI